MPYQGADYDTSDKAVTHVYLIVRDRENVVICRSVWTKAQVERHKERYSAAYKSGKKDSPWLTNWQAMARKTVIRDAVARGELPVSVDIQQMATNEEVIEAEFVRRTVGDHARLSHSESDALADRLEPPKSADDLAEMLDGDESSGDGQREQVSGDETVDAPPRQQPSGEGRQKPKVEPESFAIGADESGSAYKNRITAFVKSCQSMATIRESLGPEILSAHEAGSITDRQ